MVSFGKLLLPPNDEQILAIKTEIREETDRYENNMKLLEEWIRFHPNLPKNCDTNILSVFLRGCKHDMEATKKKLEIFFTCKTKMDDIFTLRELNKQEKICQNNFINLIMPTLTNEGYRVSYLTFRSKDVAKFDLKTTMINISRYGMLRSCRETMIAGDIYIFDSKNFTASHVPKVMIPLLKRSLYVFQEAFAYRIRAIYMINTDPVLDLMISMMKVMLKEKLRNRIHVDRDMGILAKNIPLKCLPKELGGTAPNVDELIDDWNRCMDSESEFLEQLYNLKMIGNIPKLLENSCSFDEKLGVQGSFRQLNID